MIPRLFRPSRVSLVIALLALFPNMLSAAPAAWVGVVRDASGKVIPDATVKLSSSDPRVAYSARTSPTGHFVFPEIVSGKYELSVITGDGTWQAANPIDVLDGSRRTDSLIIGSRGDLALVTEKATSTSSSSGGEHLSSGEVSSLPLNTRDFSKLLLLSAGTMTDANGAANFTQQFAVNGQRGSATVFALDGADTTDPEMGGATFSNFNVDAIEEVEAQSGVMDAEIGHGAAGYTNVVTRSGTNDVHGSVFEFVRNAAFDARNYFDHVGVDGRRIPPFVRNEFGFTNGGPFVIPHIYDGRGRTFYFGQYQGFRQVLGTTQVLPVPTALERQGIDTATFPGDTLIVPVSPAIQPVLDAYPLPNDPNGPYGARTYATSSKVATRTDQFSIRIDHRLSGKAQLFTRFSLNQVTGPVTNPDQTAIDPSFGVEFFDHQRSVAVKYARTVSPHFVSDTSLAYIRSTPFFPAGNHTQPGIGFGDGLFVAFDAPAGSIFGSYSNLYQLKQDMTGIRGQHTFRWGAEIRVNRDSTIFGTAPNGAYSFGGGTAYSPVLIKSASGTHDIAVGGPLPDSLTGLLTATPYSYNISAPAEFTPVGGKFDEAGVRREAYNFYFQDTWKATPRLTLSYGLRYEVNSRIHEATKRTSLPVFLDASGRHASYTDRNANQIFVINPQPPYGMDWGGWGPRVAIDYDLGHNTVLHAGGSIATRLPNLWQENFLTAGLPFVFNPFSTALPGVPIPFHNTFVPQVLPSAYDVQGQLIFPNRRSEDAKPNTQLDLQRFQKDVAALTPGQQVQLPTASGIVADFKNGYIGSYRLGFDHTLGRLVASANYVATVGVHLPSVYSPNSYTGADPAFAPFTQFDFAGHPTGGYGSESLIASQSHSSYHALQTSLTSKSAWAGLQMQASYTYSKSLDDTSAVLGGLFGTAGVILQTLPQNPWNPSAEKGPSTFDVTHSFTVSVIEFLPLERVRFLRPLGRTVTNGWQILNITTLSSGPPFTVLSGIQQTGVGAGGTDRPDLVETPGFSTSRSIRADYFGRGANNASFFSIPLNVPGGTGPNHGRFGTLGRDTFRGPGFHNFDIALIKDTSFGHRGGGELGTIQFRAEFFNIFNNVNFGLPANVVRGSGFGIISKTAGSSRQIQFSLKLIY
jgi:Carboxypeptidase regulatory-like domain/TonB dependent receptor-like, beta-barrel/TonB-dependent Receptor Plug Domain